MDINDIFIKVVDFIKLIEEFGIKLEEVEYIVFGGRGMKNVENFKIFNELVDVLGGIVGVLRVVVDVGWMF